MIDQNRKMDVKVAIVDLIKRNNFVKGYVDAKNGLCFCKQYEDWSVKEQLNYERGRAAYFLLPKGLIPIYKGEVNAQAIPYLIRPNLI